MTEDAVSRARAEASRGNYTSMAHLARALYETGLGPREVMRECYGTDFPEEFFLLAEKDPDTLDLLIDFTNQPWQLAIPLSQGGPPPEPDSRDWIERRAFAYDPQLVPLALPLGADTPLNGRVICYHLDELSADRPTVFGIWKTMSIDDEIKRYDVSLLEIIHRHHADHLRLLIHQRHLPSNRGTGSVGAADIGEAQELLNRIEALQRALHHDLG
ncbi:hypothetical protein [Streptomyces sp. I05A-00742]|uniref:hypothetical protein n=1 Tax=Streptomyces sp. I05A-00742 TaxID=2732853 RepID=UPI001488BD42|nr:hypothetical protein [Streptomyces sp. I05A-00742]